MLNSIAQNGADFFLHAPPMTRGAALLRLAQAQGAVPPPDMFQPPAWISYGGGEAILLAIALLVMGGGFAWAGARLRGGGRRAPGRRTPRCRPGARPRP